MWNNMNLMAYINGCTDYINIGSSGFAQLGQPNYEKKARFEGEWLKKYINNQFKKQPRYCTIEWKSFPYDIGSIASGDYQLTEYHEIVLWYQEDNKAHLEFFKKLEAIDFDALEPLIAAEYALLDDDELSKDNEIFNQL